MNNTAVRTSNHTKFAGLKYVKCQPKDSEGSATFCQTYITWLRCRFTLHKSVYPLNLVHPPVSKLCTLVRLLLYNVRNITSPPSLSLRSWQRRSVAGITCAVAQSYDWSRSMAETCENKISLHPEHTKVVYVAAPSDNRMRTFYLLTF